MSHIASIKDRLKNEAKNRNRPFQEILSLYGLERTLYRLSVSSYNQLFVLKGGVLLYGLFQSKFDRSTTDIDLLGLKVYETVDSMYDIFSEIFISNLNHDGLEFNINSLKIRPTQLHKKNHGLEVSNVAYLGKSKINIRIDIGFDDIVYPSKESLQYPVILDFPEPKLFVYSKESIISEKVQIITSLGIANTRSKDFFDIYLMIISFDFEYDVLYQAFEETFRYRKTKKSFMNAIDSLEKDILQQKKRWESFVKSKGVLNFPKFEENLKLLKEFLKPLQEKTNMINHWNHHQKKWINITGEKLSCSSQ